MNVCIEIEDEHAGLIEDPMALLFKEKKKEFSFRTEVTENVNHILNCLKPYQKPKLNYSFCNDLMTIRLKPNSISEMGIVNESKESFILKDVFVINQNVQTGVKDSIFYEEVDLFKLRFFDGVQKAVIFNQSIYLIKGTSNLILEDMNLYNYTFGEKELASKLTFPCR